MFSRTTDSSDRTRRDATPEHAAWMVVSAAEVLAAEHPDPSARARFAAIARRLLGALRSSRVEVQAVRAASPVISGPGGARRPIIELLAAFGDDPDSGVRAARTSLLAADWQSSARELRRDRPPSSRSRQPVSTSNDGPRGSFSRSRP